MSAEARLAELLNDAPAQQAKSLLDYVDGEAGWTYRPLEFGHQMVLTENRLRAQGFQPAPDTDGVQITICIGQMKVHRRPATPGEYQAWRAPVGWIEELRRRAEAAQVKAQPLSPHNHETEEQEIARMRAKLAEYDARGQG